MMTVEDEDGAKSTAIGLLFANYKFCTSHFLCAKKIGESCTKITSCVKPLFLADLDLFHAGNTIRFIDIDSCTHPLEPF